MARYLQSPREMLSTSKANFFKDARMRRELRTRTSPTLENISVTPSPLEDSSCTDGEKPSQCSFCGRWLDKVLQMAKEKRELEWEGCKLSFFEDLTKELVEKRRAFNIVKKHLLVFPATLVFTWKGNRNTI